MKYLSYFASWVLCVGGCSLYYKYFWDKFFSFYYLDLYNDAYGFVPAGMPDFNWKINLIIWFSGVLFIGFVFFLICDSVCKSHFKSRKKFPLLPFIINQLAATALYVCAGVLSDYEPWFYYMPIFLLSRVIGLAFPNTITVYNFDSWMTALIVFHSIIFSAIPVYFYLKERQHQLHILKREAEFRLERAEKDKASGEDSYLTTV